MNSTSHATKDVPISWQETGEVDMLPFHTFETRLKNHFKILIITFIHTAYLLSEGPNSEAWDGLDASPHLLCDPSDEEWEPMTAHDSLTRRVVSFGLVIPIASSKHYLIVPIASSKSGRRCSPPPPESSSGNSCILKDMFGTNVAYGTMQFNTTAPEGFYSVIIDEVIRENVCLYVESRTLEDVSEGEAVAWLKIFIIIQ
ncbi:hypothetical protein GIB67_030743 [Kingdonia uniflora]|uniref:Uncharacterized protein n=1 Tax=Kingdonia uniflora TaxID=39325 RepID=A0A7J7L332_9MAGN|nr:hypothetical protein GIB67_030743 [Kingdonia uniflora]